MITVFYEKYYNDNHRNFKEESFCSYDQFIDWFFGLCDGKYSEDISIPNPDRWAYMEGPRGFNCNCVWTKGFTYWIHMIKDGERIVMSDGLNTNGIKHWNNYIKQMCRDMIKRKEKPTFNFG